MKNYWTSCVMITANLSRIEPLSALIRYRNVIVKPVWRGHCRHQPECQRWSCGYNTFPLPAYMTVVLNSVKERQSWLMCLQHVGFPFLCGMANGFRAVLGRGASLALSAEACWFFIGMSAMQLHLRLSQYLTSDRRGTCASNTLSHEALLLRMRLLTSPWFS